jgi:hypothetical protein
MTFDLDEAVRQYDTRYGGSDWYERISPAHQHGALDSKCTRTLHTDHHNDLARILNALRHTAQEADSVELWKRVVEWIRLVPISYLKTFGSQHPNKLLHYENWEGYQADAMDCCKSCCDSCCEYTLTEEVIQWAHEAYASLREAARRTGNPRYWPYLQVYAGFVQEVLDLFFADKRELHEQWRAVHEDVREQAEAVA